jgi:predicted nucleic acid-binding protein
LRATVIDASASAAWVIPDESSDAAEELYAHACMEDGGYWAPQLWPWEMGNLLLIAARRGRIAPDAPGLALERLAATRIQLDAAADLHRQLQVARLAATHDLTFYDAAYLELVLRLNGQLASRDRKLLSAAAACGIVCLSF